MGSEFGNRISYANSVIVFYSNYVSILLSFQDMTTRWTTDERRTDVAIKSSITRNAIKLKYGHLEELIEIFRGSTAAQHQLQGEIDHGQDKGSG